MSSKQENGDENIAKNALRRTSSFFSEQAKPFLERITSRESKPRPSLSTHTSHPPVTGVKSQRRMSEVGGTLVSSLKRRWSSVRQPSNTLKHKRAASDTFHSVPPVTSPPHTPPLPQTPSVATPDIPVKDIPLPQSTVPRPSQDVSSSPDDVRVPALLQNGIPMLKVSDKKVKQTRFKIDPDQGLILWESKKSGIIAVENIREMRACEDGSYYRERFKLSKEVEDRWLSIHYLADGKYKTLHLVAMTRDHFVLWHDTLKKLHAVRAELMTGLGHFERRQLLWEKHYWKGADFSGDQRLGFDEVLRMCQRLNIKPNEEDIRKRFDAADSKGLGSLDFNDFQSFVRTMKRRRELVRLFRSIKGEGEFTFPVFETFVRETQKENANRVDLEITFRKYASQVTAGKLLPPLPPTGTTPEPPKLHLPPTLPPPLHSQTSTQAESPSSTPISTLTGLSSLRTALNRLSSQYGRRSRGGSHKGSPKPTPQTTLLHPPEASATPPPPPPLPPIERLTWSLESFTSFLMSHDNSPNTDTRGRVHHDMTLPLSDYYISSSHNTYLVGHQLVGVSTIEGYIRALLSGCRSVEIDIYEGETEPVITHGRTLTSKVPLRDICTAIAKYAFVTSPYPVIISAEVHCGIEQQDMIASIMKETFREMLVDSPVQAVNEKGIEVLPSPDQLKNRILLKAKNLLLAEKAVVEDKGTAVDTDTSTELSNAEEPEVVEPKPRRLSSIKRVLRPRPAPISIPVTDDGYLAPTTAAKDLPVTPFSGSVTSFGGQPITPSPKVKMSLHLLALLVYTVGVKCRGINQKEVYAVEHVFSLSEKMVNKILKNNVIDLIKHNRTHVVRIYPKGTRLNSTNYEPHRYWASGCQLVALNLQTPDQGFMINHTMFQRNGGAGYFLKPAALRRKGTPLLSQRVTYQLTVRIISAQQLPRPRDPNGREIINKSIIDPFIQVTAYVPDWLQAGGSGNGTVGRSSMSGTSSKDSVSNPSSPIDSAAPNDVNEANEDGDVIGDVSARTSPARTVTARSRVIKNNGFNPRWDETVVLKFDVVGEMNDLVFIRFAVRDDDDEEETAPSAMYCSSLASLQQGYRHLPLYDQQMSQFLFSTLFVHIDLKQVWRMLYLTLSFLVYCLISILHYFVFRVRTSFFCNLCQRHVWFNSR